jgi:hypothetical protein
MIGIHSLWTFSKESEIFGWAIEVSYWPSCRAGHVRARAARLAKPLRSGLYRIDSARVARLLATRRIHGAEAAECDTNAV